MASLMNKSEFIPSLLLTLGRRKYSFSSSRNLPLLRTVFHQTHSSLSHKSLFAFMPLRTSRVKPCQHFSVSQFPSITFANKLGIQEKMPILQAKKRVPRKKSISGLKDGDKNKFIAVAYGSSEEYDLPSIAHALEAQGTYTNLALPDDIEDALHMTASSQLDEPRHIYFFKEGCVVFWNVPEQEQKSILNLMKPYQIHPYDEALVLEEKDDLEYSFSENRTKFSKGQIFFGQAEDPQLETYAFSNALAQSVKLSLLEASLDSFVDNIVEIAENIREGKKIVITREEVFRKRGDLFSLGLAINLNSDLLDTPDFYWDRENLGNLYQKTCNNLSIPKRTKVMNMRLEYCTTFINFLNDRLNDERQERANIESRQDAQTGKRLEIMIIALIMISVIIEYLHYTERDFYKEHNSHNETFHPFL